MLSKVFIIEPGFFLHMAVSLSGCIKKVYKIHGTTIRGYERGFSKYVYA